MCVCECVFVLDHKPYCGNNGTNVHFKNKKSKIYIFLKKGRSTSTTTKKKGWSVCDSEWWRSGIFSLYVSLFCLWAVAEKHSADKTSDLMVNTEPTYTVWSLNNSCDSPTGVFQPLGIWLHTHTHTIATRSLADCFTSDLLYPSQKTPWSPPVCSDVPHTHRPQISVPCAWPSASVAVCSCCVRDFWSGWGKTIKEVAEPTTTGFGSGLMDESLWNKIICVES